MKIKKLLAGIISATVVVGAMTVSAFADGNTAVAKIGETEYSTLKEAISKAEDNATIKILDKIVVSAGDFDGLSQNNKSITFEKNDENSELSFKENYGNQYNYYALNNSGTITFKGIKITWGNSTYSGIAHQTGKIIYDNCKINGLAFVYTENETIFDNCEFTQENVEYNVWTYAAKEVTFNNCKFNCVGKSVLVYNEGNGNYKNVVNVNGCTFNATKPVEGKAAIEIDSSLLKNGVSVNIDSDSSKGVTTVTGFGTGTKSGNSLYNVKNYGFSTDTDSSKKLNASITVKNNVVAPLSDEAEAEAFKDCVAKIGDTYYTTLKDAFTAACNMNVETIDGIPTQTKGVTIDLIADIDNQEGFSAYGGEPQTRYGWHFVHNVDITLNGNGHKIDTGVYGSNHADNNKSPNIDVSSNNGKFTVKNVIVPNDLLFTVTKPGHATSDCKGEGIAESLVVEDCEFYGSNIGYDSTVKTVTFRNNKFLLTENEHDNSEAYPLWYKFDWAIKNFTFEGNTVKSQRALNLARFSENCEIVINNNNFTVANTKNKAKSAAIMLAENHGSEHPYKGNVTFTGNTVDAYSAVIVYTPTENNTNFNITATDNTLENGTKLIGYNEWSDAYSDADAKAAAEKLIKALEEKVTGTDPKFLEKSLYVTYKETGKYNFGSGEVDSIRLTLFAGIDSLDYNAVGFEVTVNGETKTFPITVVYKSVKTMLNGTETVINASEFGKGAKYIFGQTVNFPETEAFKNAAATWTPYAIKKNGEEVKGKTFTLDDIFTGELEETK